MIRVLVAHPSPDQYGVDRMLIETLDALRDGGLDPFVCVPDEGPLLDEIRGGGHDYRVFPFPVLRRALLTPRGLLGLARSTPQALRALRGVLREVKPDIVYVNTLTLPFWLVAARLQRLPVVCHVHESDDRMPRAVAMLLVAPLRLATRVITVSAATQAFVLAHAPRLRKTSTIVHNGLRFPPTPARAPEGPPTRLLVLGRLGPNKGQDLAIDALGALVSQGHDLELELAGSAYQGYEWFEQQLRDRVQQLELDGRVTFSGFRADKWDAYASAHIVLVPSRTDSLPLVAIEALAMGRPVVAAEVGGLPEIVTAGRTGLLCRANDAGDLARAIAALLDDPGLVRELAAHAVDDARVRFDLDRFKECVVSIITDALGSPVTGPRTRADA